MKSKKIILLALLLILAIPNSFAQAYQIFVRQSESMPRYVGGGATTLTLDCDSSDSVENLKQRINEKLSLVPVGNLKLIFAGTILEDGRTLADYGIQEESTVHVYAVNLYPATSVEVGGTASVLSVAAPGADYTNKTVSTAPGFTGTLSVLPSGEVSIENAAPAGTYEIQINNNFFDGNTNISTPFQSFTLTVYNSSSVTQLRPIQCGKTLSYLTSAIQASPLVGATEYTFEVTRVDNSLVNTIVTSNYYFFPATLISNGLVYGKSYSIKVKAKIGGTYTAYGNTCIVTAPTEPAQNTITKIRPIQCGKTLNYITDAIQASPVYKAVRYEFEVNNGVTSLVIPSKNYYFRLSQFPGGGVLNTPYTIRVRSSNAPTPAAFTAWGDYCVVSTPIARISETNASDSIFTVKSFPNPFASHFSLDIESSSDALVELKVYDMLGRQLEVRKASVSELSVLELGRNYPSGIYNVIVSQGENVKSVRMMKR